jgi:hypothetical protein
MAITNIFTVIAVAHAFLLYYIIVPSLTMGYDRWLEA